MKNVTIYTTPTCPHCKTAKNYLTSKGISFIEKDVSRDLQAQSDLARLNIQGVPAIIIDDEVIVGFDQYRIDQLLNFSVINCEKCGTKLRIPTNKGKIKVSCPSCSHQFITNT